MKLELPDGIPEEGTVPLEVRDDAARAAGTHPGGVLLPLAFTTAELAGGQWGPAAPGTSATPQSARDGLAAHLRVTVPWQLDLGPQERQRSGRGGTPFHAARVERLVRIGPDGPEGPRPSDPDPQPPIMVQTGFLADEDEDAPIELDEDAKRFLRLFHEEEEQRRTARYRKH